MRHTAVLAALLFLTACSGESATVAARAAPPPLVPPPLPIEAPAGLYELDPGATQIGFVVEYVDLTKVAGRFTQADATLQLEPSEPERSSIMVTIDPASVRTDIPGFDALISGNEFLDVARMPELSFLSSQVVRTGAADADITGDLTLHGVTRPVTLKTHYEAARTSDPVHPRVRFVAETKLRRSDFGLQTSLPVAGDPAGVIDDVKVVIDAEFKRVNPTPPAIVGSRSGRK